MIWFVYVLECVDGTLYTGVSTHPDRRVHDHNHTSKGAKYTRGRRPVKLLWAKACQDRTHAQGLEVKIKSLNREQKLAYISYK